jgi:RimJ/RimL family protein N-acetyltransferase
MAAPVPLEFPDPPLGDAVAGLRSCRDADLEAIVAACRDPDVARYTSVADPFTEADARAWLDADRRRRRDGSALTFAIVAAGGGELAGLLTVRVGADDRAVAELGYIVAPWARGNGLAGAAVRLAAAWALAAWELGRVQVTTHLGNRPSERVAEKAGFTREAVLRAWRPMRGGRPDVTMWSRLPGGT